MGKIYTCLPIYTNNYLKNHYNHNSDSWFEKFNAKIIFLI